MEHNQELLYFNALNNLPILEKRYYQDREDYEGMRTKNDLWPLIINCLSLAKPIVLSLGMTEEIHNEIGKLKNTSLAYDEPDHPFGAYWIQPIKGAMMAAKMVGYGNCTLMGIGVHEMNDGNYFTANLMADESSKPFIYPVIITNKYKDQSFCKAVHHYVTSACKSFQEKDTYIGHEKTNFRIRVGEGSGRQLRKINQIIRIARKKEINQYASQTSNQIEWHHCWSVMGHWRRLSGTQIGKDRHAQYNQVGRTWVTPCIKGNKEAPYIKKIRHYIDNQKGLQ